MYKLHISQKEKFDEDREIFIPCPEANLELEHSLYSISRWEEKYKKPFLSTQKTALEMYDYVKMMITNVEPTDEMLSGLTEEDVKAIGEYINENRTATTFSKDQKGKPSTEIITSELIYCWMVQEEIPFECQYWHLSRLLTLINVVAIKNQPPKKQNQIDAMKHSAEVNKARRAAHASKPSMPHIPH